MVYEYNKRKKINNETLGVAAQIRTWGSVIQVIDLNF